MNEDKPGELSFYYPHTLVLMLGHYAKAYFHLPYRQTQKELSKVMQKTRFPSISDFSTINRRMNKLDIKN